MKKCPKCRTYSYSASITSKWKCPECDKDLTDIKAIPAGHKEKSKENNSPDFPNN